MSLPSFNMRELIEAGYVNEFLLKLATPAESVLVADLRAKLKAGGPHPLPTHGAAPAPEDDVETIHAPAPRRMATVNRIDGGGDQIGYGRPPAGGRRVNL